MSELELNAKLFEGLDGLAAASEKSPDEAEPNEVDLDGIRADGELVGRCVSGEVAAWEELYARCHPPLLRSIECILGMPDPDGNLVDELAARVWYALLDGDGRLLARFDMERGARLGTFLRCIAKDVTTRYFRTEARRRRRESLAGKRPEARQRGAVSVDLAMAEFVDTLTPAEQAFLDHYLLGEDPPDGTSKSYSEANVWQLASRIRQKLKRFFHLTTREEQGRRISSNEGVPKKPR